MTLKIINSMKIILLIGLLISSLPQLLAQPLLKCTEYNSGEEMQHSRVSCYAQDSKGLLWMGTWIGLCRYDGREFHFVLPQQGGEEQSPYPLGSNRIIKMTVDSRDNIWCLNYDQGVYRLDRSNSTFQAVLPLVAGYEHCSAKRGRFFATQRNHAVWVELEDGTLVRFDDRNPEQNSVLACPSGVKERTVYEVHEDTRGREWILTDHGVLLYGQGEISDRPFNRMVERNRRCYFCSNTLNLLAEYDEQGGFTPIATPQEAGVVQQIQAIDKERIGILAENGILLYNVLTHKMLHVANTTSGTPLRNISRLLLDNQSRLWMTGAEGGLYCLRPNEEKALALKEVSTNNKTAHPSFLMQDNQGVIWVRTAVSELCWVDEKEMRLHPYSECIKEGKTLDLNDFNISFVDQQKNLWISSGTKLSQLTFGRRQFQTQLTQPNIEVRALLDEDDQHLWYGNKQGMLCRRNIDTGKEQYLTPQGHWSARPVVFDDNGIYCLMRDKDNRVWVGTRGSGLYVLTPQGDHLRTAHFQDLGGRFDLNCNNIYDFCQDEMGRIWIGTFGGGINVVLPQPDGSIRFLHQGNELKQYPLEDFDVVRCLKADGHGRILAGTNQGVLAFSTRFNQLSDIQFHRHQMQSPQAYALQDNMVMRVLCDHEGTYYVTTYARGLSRVEGSGTDSLRFIPIPNREYPAGDVAVSAIVNRKGQVWSIAECGITGYLPEKGLMWYFDQYDFEQPYALTECAPIERKDGTLVLGMTGGICLFHPDSLSKSKHSPQIVLTERLYAEGVNLHQQDINDMDTLIVQPNQRSSALRFSAVDLTPARPIRYAYWMQGANESIEAPQWVYTVTPEVNFTNLPPGEYRLFLKSTNSDGVWSSNIRILTIQVVPTFLERWGSMIANLVGLILAIVALSVYLHRLRERQRAVVHHEVSAAKIELLSHPTDPSDQEFIQKLMAVLESRLSNGDLQVNDLADNMNMSRATLYRRLKQAVDLSPNDFIHQVRMRRSAELLTTTSDSVAQIAYAVGFNNPKYFSKCFRQDFGVSPAEYRAKKKAENKGSDKDD